METYGKLIVRVFINTHVPDEHGRMRGNWRTLRTWYMIDRESVDQVLTEFYEANPVLANRKAWVIDTRFTTEEHITTR